MSKVLLWDIYEVRSASAKLTGVSLRGTLRKKALQEDITLLTDNATDRENTVRFAVLSADEGKTISRYITTSIPRTEISVVGLAVPNPVLSKLSVNNEGKYKA